MLNKEDKLYVLVDLNEKLILGKIEKITRKLEKHCRSL